MGRGAAVGPRAAATVAALALGATGCALYPEAYAAPSPTVAIAVPADPGDGFTPAEHAALRVWATTCDTFRNGTAWMLDQTTAVTNRHVVEEATEIHLSDYQGREYPVTSAAISTTDDLALITIDGSFPEPAPVAATEPEVGDALSASGYPYGGPLETLEGPLLGVTDNELDPDGAPVYLAQMGAQVGSSGSAVVDAAGDVVGVIFSSDGEAVTGVVTLPTLQRFLARDDARETVEATCD
ncbi:S1 family peptidase [Demequina pelophila]|uniref:S1 family peptidase n=1 Tax=Demequina pelophila TaxID=1638984 RepID=UPI0007819BC3|nr:serine protease [Demequina pelophila]